MQEVGSTQRERLIKIGTAIAAGASALSLVGCGSMESRRLFQDGSTVVVVEHEHIKPGYKLHLNEHPPLTRTHWLEWLLVIKQCHINPGGPPAIRVCDSRPKTISVTEKMYATYNNGEVMRYPLPVLDNIKIQPAQYSGWGNKAPR